MKLGVFVGAASEPHRVFTRWMMRGNAERSVTEQLPPETTQWLRQLSVWPVLDEVIESVMRHRVTVLDLPTGSGKTLCVSV